MESVILPGSLTASLREKLQRVPIGKDRLPVPSLFQEQAIKLRELFHPTYNYTPED